MLQLFLDETTWDDDEFLVDKASPLEKLESVLWSLMTATGLSEARLWLCDTLSAITSISRPGQRDLFLKLLKSETVKLQLAPQVLQLIFEKRPQKLGPVIAKKSRKLVNYFEGNPRRILQWFSSFSSSGDVGHAKGARALSQFAFINRDICWEELEWKGKHGQSPAMVATKPHYFLDLDVQRTVENFLEYVPEFWSSDEFSESLMDGDIFLTDPSYFIDFFIDCMYEEKLQEVWDVIEEFLVQQPFALLCQHLLIGLQEQGLRIFIDSIPKYLEAKSKSSKPRPATEWLEIIISKFRDSLNFDNLLLLNALTNQSRQLIRFVKEEGSDEEKGRIKELAHQLSELSGNVKSSLPILREGHVVKALESVKNFGLLSWAIHLRLSEEFVTSASWESAFTGNGIKYVRSERYSLPSDDPNDDYESQNAVGCSMSTKHRKFKGQGKKRKLRSSPAASYEDDPVDSTWSMEMIDLQAKEGDWLLSIDGYSTRWNIKDLPEHISRHCFTTWWSWLFPMLEIAS